MRKRSSAPPFPSREELLAFIRENPQDASTRAITRAFDLRGRQRAALRQLLTELVRSGELPPGRRADSRTRGRRNTVLPRVALVEVRELDADGEVIARPVQWRGPGKPPVIFMAPEKRGHPALGPGDRALAGLRGARDGTYEGRTIRRIGAAPALVLGRYERTGGQGRILPVERGRRTEFVVESADAGEAQPGELVQAEVLPARRLGLRRARIVERLGRGDEPRAFSLIAIHDHGIADAFADDVLAEAKAACDAPVGGREDLRPLPLVTIDGPDARDFDDAVWAEPDPDPENRGGWHAVVAIADVGWYVRAGSALDRAAYERGNSVYFPDRVVPMLPEALSAHLCSLRPGEDRPCLAAHLWIDKNGRLLRHRFSRAVIRSIARLTYEQVQAARDGDADEATRPLLESVIAPVFGAYRSLKIGREKRGALELDLAERQVLLAEDGTVADIRRRTRLDAHKLIEEFMIAANVAAAEALTSRRQPALYRVHDMPARERLEALRRFLATLELALPGGGAVRPSHFNRVLEAVAGTPFSSVVNQIVLRSQAQAEYSPVNIGHFGLGLSRYCHFTSPIRRYADLMVHRALIRTLRLGADGGEDEARELAEAGAHVSATERRAQAAERDTMDRYTAAFLGPRVGEVFAGTITGVTRFGLFVALDETGGDGLIPVRSLPHDRYVHDEDAHALTGRTAGIAFRLGDALEVVLREANPLSGGMILGLAGQVETTTRAHRIKRGPGRRSRHG
ncbi:MAG: ribonuclease R [Rhodospirillales bacterium]|nr:ribonuclease R [Rhodospirillales bacterium]